MLPSYIDIGPIVSDKKIFKVFCLAIQGKEAPPPSNHTFNESWQLEQTWKNVTKATFLPSNIEISPVDSDKKNFKIFYIDI